MKKRFTIGSFLAISLARKELLIEKKFDEIERYFASPKRPLTVNKFLKNIAASLIIRVCYWGDDRHLKIISDNLDKRFFKSLSLSDTCKILDAAVTNKKREFALNFFESLEDNRKISALKFKNYSFCKSFAKAGDHSFLKDMVSKIRDPRQIRSFFLSKNNKLLRLAAHFNDLDFIKIILDIGKKYYFEDELLNENTFKVVRAACNREDRDILEVFLDRLKANRMLGDFLSHNDYRIFYSSIKLGNTATFVTLYDYAKSIQIDNLVLSSNNYEIIELCFKYSFLNLLKFLIHTASSANNNFWNSPVVFAYSYNAVLDAAKSNKTDVLKVMAEEIDNPIFWFRILTENNYKIFKTANKNDSFEANKILLSVYNKYSLLYEAIKQSFFRSNTPSLGKKPSDTFLYTAAFAYDELKERRDEVIPALNSLFSNGVLTRFFVSSAKHRQPGGLLRALNMFSIGGRSANECKYAERSNVNIFSLNQMHVSCTSLFEYRRIAKLLLPYSTAEYILMNSLFPREVGCMILAHAIGIEVDGNNDNFTQDFLKLLNITDMKGEKLKYHEDYFPCKIKGHKTLNFIDKLETYLTRTKPRLSTISIS